MQASKAAIQLTNAVKQQGKKHACKAQRQACLVFVLLAHLLDVQVPADNAEHVHVLSLVFMNTLDLDIIQGIDGHLGPCDLLQASYILS